MTISTSMLMGEETPRDPSRKITPMMLTGLVAPTSEKRPPNAVETRRNDILHLLSEAPENTLSLDQLAEKLGVGRDCVSDACRGLNRLQKVALGKGLVRLRGSRKKEMEFVLARELEIIKALKQGLPLITPEIATLLDVASYKVIGMIESARTREPRIKIRVLPGFSIIWWDENGTA